MCDFFLIYLKIFTYLKIYSFKNVAKINKETKYEETSKKFIKNLLLCKTFWNLHIRDLKQLKKNEYMKKTLHRIQNLWHENKRWRGIFYLLKIERQESKWIRMDTLDFLRTGSLPKRPGQCGVGQEPQGPRTAAGSWSGSRAGTRTQKPGEKEAI